MNKQAKIELLTPQALWKNVDVTSRNEVVYRAVRGEHYTAKEVELMYKMSTSDGDVSIGARLYEVLEPNGLVVLIEDPRGVNHIRELENLLRLNYSILVVDYSNLHNWGTTFPKKLEYGDHTLRGDRMENIKYSAVDSSYFLYARIVSSSIAAARTLKPDHKVIVAAVGEAAEFTVQAVAMDGRADGLVIIGGNVYQEYNDSLFYDKKSMPVISDEMIPWMTAIASVAYVKYLKCPTFIVSGSNSLKCDIDKLKQYTATMDPSLITILQARGERDTIDVECFDSLKSWIACIVKGDALPLVPSIELKLYKNRDNCVEINADYTLIIDSVVLNYSYTELDRRFRRWRSVDAKRLSLGGEYIASFPNEFNETPVFVYATINYANGLSISSYLACGEYDEELEDDREAQNIVVKGSENYDEFEVDRNAYILFTEEKKLVKTGLGLYGVASTNGGLRTYAISEKRVNKNRDILQIDFFTQNKKTVYLEVESLEDGKLVKYYANVVARGSSQVFTSIRLVASDFKDKSLIPLESWENVKSFSVVTPNVAVGNIIFV